MTYTNPSKFFLNHFAIKQKVNLLAYKSSGISECQSFTEHILTTKRTKIRDLSYLKVYKLITHIVNKVESTWVGMNLTFYFRNGKNGFVFL